MTYQKPVLRGYAGIAAVRDASGHPKIADVLEGGWTRTDPAYQVDE